MLYQLTETKNSQEQMQAIFSQLKIQTCLLGGWAVNYLVNQNFQKATGTVTYELGGKENPNNKTTYMLAKYAEYANTGGNKTAAYGTMRLTM